MNYLSAKSELQKRPTPKVSLKVIILEGVAVLLLAVLLINIFSG